MESAHQSPYLGHIVQSLNVSLHCRWR